MNIELKARLKEGVSEKENTKSVLAKKEAFYQKYNSNFYESYNITINKGILRKIA